MISAGREAQSLAREHRPSEPKLLVEWEPGWHAFVSSIRPALMRSPARLSLEVEAGLSPRGGGAASLLLHTAACIALLVVPSQIGKLTTSVELRPSNASHYELFYYSNSVLPLTTDTSGAQAGVEGRTGGREAFNPYQAIRVVRGERMAQQIADAPTLKLPLVTSAVANLLALASAPSPGPVPADDIRSTRKLEWQRNAVEPSPEVNVSGRHLKVHISRDVVGPAVDVVSVSASRTMPQFAREAVAPSVDARELRSGKRIPWSAFTVIEPPVSAPASETARRAHLVLLARLPVEPVPSLERVNGRSVRPGALSGYVNSAVAPPVELAGIVSNGSPSLRAFATSPGGNVAGILGVDANRVTGGIAGAAERTASSGTGSGTESPGPESPGITHGKAGVTGLILSAHPGEVVGRPVGAGEGALSMSPRGTGNVGLGGSGAGNGLGIGSGPGGASGGVGTGAGLSGPGHGSDASARGGISPHPGPGGTGDGTTEVMAGVSIGGSPLGGGSTVVNIPSFGGPATPPSLSPPSSEHGPRRAPAITIVASPRAGGGINLYGRLKGSRMYTIYFKTGGGTAVLQYSDPQSVNAKFDFELTPPEPTRSDIPAGVPRERLVLACVIEPSGTLRNIRVIESRGTEATQRMLTAIESWRFRPVLRRGEAIEVDAILGLEIDTR
ncbi:MAG TPA: hypothetical protein VN622_14640 [Clostridia bacterium]|nr:hypothetical protein [Clostridia bacterium]